MSSQLWIPWEAQDERSVQAQLQEIDLRLFLDKRADHAGRIFYVVCFYQGGSQPPEDVLDWREDAHRGGAPKPLSSAVGYAIQKQMRKGAVNVAGVIEHNRKLKQKKEDEFDEQRLEAAQDVMRSDKRAAAPHRSQGLYLSRQRERRRRGK